MWYEEMRVRNGSESNDDKRISLAPLDFEDAMRAILQTGPHPKDDEPAPAEGKEKAPRKGHRKRKADRAPT